jgi:hypothetical protein
VLCDRVDVGSDTFDGDPSGVVALSDTPTAGPDTGLDALDGDPSSAVAVSDT